MHRVETLTLDAEVERILTDAGLPVSDLAATPGLHLLGIRNSGSLIGIVGIEPHGAVGLLRSLAVIGAHRGSGLGSMLVFAAEAWAADRGIGLLYLLTLTAAGFFADLGYATIPRSDAPEAIRGTPQFCNLCPSSATLMRKTLTTRTS